VRKIYIDFGVSINFKRLDIRDARATGRAAAGVGLRSAASSIPAVTAGWLLYIKPPSHGTTREWMCAATLRSPRFPHEAHRSMLRSQLEAYRASAPLSRNLHGCVPSHRADARP